MLKLFESWVPLMWIEDEAKKTQLAYKLGLPVPAVDGVIEYDRRHGIIMERIEGLSMLQCMLCMPWKTGYYAHTLAELHVKINAIMAPEGAQTMHQALEYCINNENTIPQETREAVLCILEKLPDGEAVCHYDLHANNVMMSARGPVIIDWMGSRKGDPMADIARTWLLSTMPPIPMKMLLQWIFDPWLRHFYEEYLKEYTRLTPVTPERLELWKIPILAGRIIEERTKARKKFLLGAVEKLLVPHSPDPR